jgi:hypothetical protein
MKKGFKINDLTLWNYRIMCLLFLSKAMSNIHLHPAIVAGFVSLAYFGGASFFSLPSVAEAGLQAEMKKKDMLQQASDDMTNQRVMKEGEYWQGALRMCQSDNPDTARIRKAIGQGIDVKHTPDCPDRILAHYIRTQSLSLQKIPTTRQEFIERSQAPLKVLGCLALVFSFGGLALEARKRGLPLFGPILR